MQNNKEIKLSDLIDGQAGEVVSITGNSELRFRLLEMGIIKGTKITFERVAPLGDPLIVSVQGFRLSLRREEAALILVKPLSQIRLRRRFRRGQKL